MFYFVEHPKAVDHDPGSKRQRKHFFKFMEGVMSAILRWESNQLHFSENQIKNVKKSKDKHDLPSTINFNTNTQGQACILSSCGKIHKNSSGKPTKSLQFCEHFSKNLKLPERNKLIKAANVCTKCLIPGHKQSTCKFISTCSNS